ncbi:MAG: hypothetical protein MK110_00855 [Fuerstiella sp.]|nr:hypothetical protein [Fuerstiella sp.]
MTDSKNSSHAELPDRGSSEQAASNYDVSPVLMSLPVREEISEPVPVAVLSEFPGAGTTTLRNHVLNNRQGLRVTLIVNDLNQAIFRDRFDQRLLTDGKFKVDRNK